MNVEYRKCKTCKEKFRGYKQNGIWKSALCPNCRGVKHKKKREKQILKQRKLKEEKIQRIILKKEKKKLTKKYQESERKKLHREAWKLISLKIRNDAVGWRGYVYCYTCGKAVLLKEAHCGHRYHGKIDFDERNLKAQCSYCNTYLSGNLGSYERRLIEENGLEWCKKLELDANTHLGYSIQELKSIIEKYEEMGI